MIQNISFYCYIKFLLTLDQRNQDSPPWSSTTSKFDSNKIIKSQNINVLNSSNVSVKTVKILKENLALSLYHHSRDRVTITVKSSSGPDVAPLVWRLRNFLKTGFLPSPYSLIDNNGRKGTQ